MLETFPIPQHQPFTTLRKIKKMQNQNTVTKMQNKILFPLGETVITIGAKLALKESGESPLKFLALHQNGNWGIVGKEDWKENDFSVKEGFRILSAYRTNLGEKIYVITECTRELTTILLPEEY